MEYKTKLKILSWNVRGLGDKTKRLAIRHTVISEKLDILCLQETKLRSFDDNLRKETVGRRLNAFVTLNSQGSRGGILIVWQDRRFTLLQQSQSDFCLTVQLRDTLLNHTIQMTGVYGPTNSSQRTNFFTELKEANPNALNPSQGIPWIVCGDFNCTLRREERNSTSSEWRWPLAFSQTVSSLGLRDIYMQGRRFTWANTRQRPAMAKLDRCLISADWSMKFPNSTQRTLPNTSSDHCPVLYTAATNYSRSKIVRFENFWL